MENFKKVINQLKNLRLKKKYKNLSHIFFDDLFTKKKTLETNPIDYYLQKFKDLEKVYQSEDKAISLNIYEDLYWENKSGDGIFANNGTFLKALALLIDLKKQGINNLELTSPLESCQIQNGESINSKVLKSIEHLDERLFDNIEELDNYVIYSAFIELAEHLRIKLSYVVDFRYPSIDNDWSLSKPEWFYWVKNNIKLRESEGTQESFYGPPIFLKKEEKDIIQKIQQADYDNLIAPKEKHRNLFVDTPNKVARVEGKIIGLHNKTQECILAHRIKTYPINSEPHHNLDVSYFRYYNHEKFNYISYNTIDHVDNELRKYRNESLWEFLANSPLQMSRTLMNNNITIYYDKLMPEELKEIIVSQNKDRDTMILSFD